MTAQDRYDLVVIGGGTAGMTAAKLVARAGRRVLLVERDRTGGDCLTTGCVPSKALLASARRAHDVRHAARLGIDTTPPRPDWDVIRDRIARIIEEIGVADSTEAIERSGATVLSGDARFVGPGEIVVSGRRVHAGAVVVATGSRPRIPAIPGLAEAGWITNVEAFALPRLPERLLVIGGGPTGVELGQAFARLGCAVTLVERAARIMPQADGNASAALHAALTADGMRIVCAAEVIRVERREGGTRVVVRTASGETELPETDEILVASGREPVTDGLGLDTAGVMVGSAGITVDARLRTSADRVWACGDVIGPPFLTHAAEDQARTVAKNVLGGRGRWSGRLIPWAVYTDPEIAGVGLTVAEAQVAHGADLEVLRLPYRAVDRAVTDGAGDGFVTVLLTPGWERGKLGGQIAGAHAVGERAAEIVQQFAFMMSWRLPAGLLAKTVQAYPTYGLAARMAIGLHWTRMEQADAPSAFARLRDRARTLLPSG